MEEWPSEDEIKENCAELISLLETGQYKFLDGIVSSQTKVLAEAFETTGIDMTSLWAMTPQDWTCPACGRHKTQIARPNKNNHLMCRLVEHHDHMQELLKQKFEEISVSLDTVVADQMSEQFAKRSSAMISSFDNIVVCDDCNVADINAKKASNAHRWFSFSSAELRQIVLPKSNLPHDINEDIACRLWKQNEETFHLRLKIAHRIAEIAATNSHWFQPTEISYQPEIIMKRAQDIISRKRAYGVLYSLVGEKESKPEKDLTAWRKRKYFSPRTLPTERQIQHIAKVKSKAHWEKVSELWVCEGCGRSKNETVKITKKNGWSFSLTTRWYRDPLSPDSRKQYTLCSDCGFVAERLGEEVRYASSKPAGPLSCLIEVEEISSVVMPMPHTRHNIKNTVANAVVAGVIRRIDLNEARDCV